MNVKKLVFDYAMELHFSSPVTEHRFQLRCIPVTGPRQQIVDVQLQIEPKVELETSVDSFGSKVVTGFIPQPHDTFKYSVTGIAFVDSEHTEPEPYRPLYLYDSALTIPGPQVEQLIAQCRDRLEREYRAKHTDEVGGQDDVIKKFASNEPLEVARIIMDEVYGMFTYAPGSTTIRTTAEEALSQRRGVCQDYAHVMLAVCRRTGLAARYIAGLLGGEGATHAWVEVYYKDRWLGFDPTHNRMVNDNYITIAHGRDYRDCMLDIGIFSGANVEQTQWVNASVHEQE